MNEQVSQVHTQLWIANIQGARTCDKEDFDRVVTVCQDSIGDNIGCEYDYFNMADGEVDGYGGDSSYELFEEAAQTILDALRNGETVLVHCHAGQSRSASTSIAALSVYQTQYYDETYDQVNMFRPQIHPDGLLERHAMKFIEERTEFSHKPFVEES